MAVFTSALVGAELSLAARVITNVAEPLVPLVPVEPTTYAVLVDQVTELVAVVFVSE